MPKSLKKQSLIDAFQIDFSEIKQEVDKVGNNFSTSNKKVICDKIESKQVNNSNKTAQWTSEPVSQWTSEPWPRPWSRPVDQWTSEPVSEPVDQWTSEPVSEPVSQWTSEPVNQSRMDKKLLTDKQLAVLKFIYFNRPFKVAGKKNCLSSIGNMGRSNARNQLKSLEKKGYIYKPYGVNNGIFMGSTCRVNEEKCMLLFGPTLISNPAIKKQPSGPVSQWTSEPVSEPVSQWTSEPAIVNKGNTVINNSVYSSSSSLNKETTTMDISLKNSSPYVAEYFEKPEFDYWREKGLTQKQLTSWETLVNCDPITILRYLRYCRFEMVDLNLEKSKPVENVFNWFYRILEKTGSYPKPSTYKSFEEKKLEEESKELEKEEKIAENRKRLFFKKQEVIFESKFWEMMNSDNSKAYKLCFSKLSTLAKNRARKNLSSPMFHAAMRDQFKKYLENMEN